MGYELKLTGKMKTYDGWNEDLHKYLQVGDYIDSELKNHFINVLPPAAMSSTLIQIGEPYSHVDGKATYSTITKIDGKWVYAGTCFRNRIENMKSYY